MRQKFNKDEFCKISIMKNPFRNNRSISSLKYDMWKSIFISYENNEINNLKANVYLMNIYYELIDSPLVAIINNKNELTVNANYEDEMFRNEIRQIINRNIHNELSKKYILDVHNNVDYYKENENELIFTYCETCGYIKPEECEKHKNMNHVCYDDVFDKFEFENMIQNIKMNHLMNETYAWCHIG